MAGITPLNNFLGPESDPVTAVTQLPKYQSLTGPLLFKSKNLNARKRVMKQARKQADKQRRESDPDLFSDGLEDDLVLGGALLVADAFAVYSWSPERRLWIPVRVQAMMVDASNHCGWDPGRDFWRSLRLSDEAPFESA